MSDLNIKTMQAQDTVNELWGKLFSLVDTGWTSRTNGSPESKNMYGTKGQGETDVEDWVSYMDVEYTGHSTSGFIRQFDADVRLQIGLGDTSVVKATISAREDDGEEVIVDSEDFAVTDVEAIAQKIKSWLNFCAYEKNVGYPAYVEPEV